ncbi:MULTISPECIES: type II secretion system F family protein [Methylophilus]|uniref:type II secretion system F family protein n=1 Tax=Methylophilus TaxID=16 RepID=UPI000362A68E|nr:MULTISPECIES: type II secretion system F family protein [Methylophilus]PPD13261.1 MAG: hypothetical protein CTY26_00125 [Methylophilus sp.]
MIFFIIILLILLVYLVYDIQQEGRRQKVFERLTFGFDSDEPDQVSLWEGAANLLQVTAIRQLLLRSLFTRTLDIIIKRAGFRFGLLEGVSILAIVSFITALATFMTTQNLGASVAVIFLAPLTIFMVWRLLAERQQKKMDLQLPGLINSMLTTMRAGGTPIQALHATSKNAENPIRDSIAQVLNQLQLGQSPIAVWKDWSDFWDTKSCRLLSTGIRVKWESGGQMASVLEHILESIEFRRKIEQRINTLTTQAKLGSIVLSLIPPLLVFLQYKVRPDLVVEMVNDPIGEKIYIYAGGLTLIGFLWLRKLAKIKME